MRKHLRKIARANMTSEGIPHPNKHDFFAKNWREYSKKKTVIEAMKKDKALNA